MEKPQNIQDYIAQLPEERKEAIEKLRKVIKENLPEGFSETLSNGMIGYVVPHSAYPEGYHCDPKLPVPFINLASQKNYIALYHFGLYAKPDILNWFTEEYPKHSKTKLNMGKSCVRFKKPEHIPYELIGELCSKIDMQDWIDTYEKEIKN